MAATHEYKYINGGASHWLLNTTPFFPKIQLIKNEENGDMEVSCAFNAAYLFDYAAAGNKVAVTFSLVIDIEGSSGSIQSVTIVKDGDEYTPAPSFTNIQHTSSIDGVGNAGSRHIKLELAKFVGPELKHLYIRENIHVWFRGMNQMGSPVYDSNNSQANFPIMSTLSSNAINGQAQFYSIAKKIASDNILQISYSEDYETIELYVPDPSGSTS